MKGRRPLRVAGPVENEEMTNLVRHRTEACGARSHTAIHDGARAGHINPRREDLIMLYTIAVVLIILWLLGLVTSYTVGGFIHILLVVAVIMILLRLISGRGL
jgi:hypothetical protein